MKEVDINRTKLLISKGKTKEAIELLLKETSLTEQALLISSRFEELERKYNSNLISNEDYNVEKSRIESSILRFLQSQQVPSVKRYKSKQTLNPHPKISFGQIIIMLVGFGAIGYTIISTLSSSAFSKSSKSIEEVTAGREKEETVDFRDSSKLNPQMIVIDDFDSTKIFNTEPEILEIAVRDFLSNEYKSNDNFEKLIRNKDFDLALKALDIADQRDSSKKGAILARRKSIFLMRKASFDNVWFSFPGDLILTVRNDKEGLYDRNGRELFEPQFDEIDPVPFEYLYCTKLEGKYGLIDYSGKELFKPQFDDIYMINPKGLIGTLKNGSYGVLSKEGMELYPPIFAEIELEEFAMLIIKVKRNGKYGYLNSEGEMILKTNINYVEQVWAETLFIIIPNVSKKPDTV